MEIERARCMKIERAKGSKTERKRGRERLIDVEREKKIEGLRGKKGGRGSRPSSQVRMIHSSYIIIIITSLSKVHRSFFSITGDAFFYFHLVKINVARRTSVHPIFP